MNLLMDALKKTEERGTSSDSSPGDGPPGSAELRERPFGPIRATRDEAGSVVIDSDDSDPALLAGPRPDEPMLSGGGQGSPGVPADSLEDAVSGSGPGAAPAPSGGTASSSPSFSLGGEDVTYDEPPPFSSLDGAGASFGSRIGVLPHVSEPPAPIRATKNGEDAAGGGGGRPSSARSGVRSTARTATTVRPASVRAAPRSFDAGVAPPGRRMGRTIGVALVLLAVTAGGATGGRHVWKTEFARPMLVRPPLPASAAEAAPVWTAGVMAGTSGDSRDPEARAPHPQRIEDPRQAQVEQRAGTVLRPPSDAGAPTRPPAGMDAAPRPPTGMDAVSRPPSGMDAAPRPPSGMGASPRPPTGMDAVSRPDTGAVIRITKRRRPDRVAASLERAYDAYRAGDAESAAEAYRAVLGHEPRNRDAFLGLAAVAAREGRWNEAAAHYARVLALDPANAVAQAALIAIGGQDWTRGERPLKGESLLKGEGLLKEEDRLVAAGSLAEEDLLKAESRLKALLSGEPRAAYLHFGLGNVYAAQSRWPEARRSYFNAYRFDRGNTDYAYNLAVSLDHLSQPESALRFYREALALARKRSPNFETAAVLARIRDLATP